MLSLALPLMGLLIVLSQWVLGVRLTRIDGQLMFTDKRSPPERERTLAGGLTPHPPVASARLG